MAKECLDMAHVTCKYRRMRTKAISAERLIALRGKRSREDIAHELRKRGHGTDAKSIWRYETGRSNPLARLLPDYANILGAASVDELYASDGDEEDRTAPRSSPLVGRSAPVGPFRGHAREESRSDRQAAGGDDGVILPGRTLEASVGASSGARPADASSARQRAAELRATGLTYQAIADELGVSWATAYRWSDPEKEQRQREMSLAYKRRIHGTCERCGAVTNYSGHGINASRFCAPCGSVVGGEIQRERTRGKGPLQLAIVAFLSEPHRYIEIRDRFGLTSSHTGVQLNRLVECGMVSRVSRGVYVAEVAA